MVSRELGKSLVRASVMVPRALGKSLVNWLLESFTCHNEVVNCINKCNIFVNSQLVASLQNDSVICISIKFNGIKESLDLVLYK